jgi:hypothetical protein
MGILKNPANEQHELSVLAQGVLATDRYVFHHKAAYATGIATVNTQVVIGYVPVDCVLVPRLCRIQVPKLSTSTGAIKIGTFGDDDALLGATNVNAAFTKFGHELNQAEGIGSATEKTAIVMTISTGLAAVDDNAGAVVADLVFRARNPFTD